MDHEQLQHHKFNTERNSQSTVRGLRVQYTCRFRGIPKEVYKVRLSIQECSFVITIVFFGNLLQRFLKPVLVRLIDETIGNDSAALVLPQVQ